MDLIDKLKNIGERIEKRKERVETEEATKNAFVMPFIAALGYDLFDPFEVVPEFTADLGIKKGEKVDYCILKDDEPIIIIECKHWREKLRVHKSQLHRYFHVCKAKFAILTNGIQFHFYTDLDEANKMDDKPFLELDLFDIKEGAVNELKRFQKNRFDADEISSVAGELKYSKQLRILLHQEFSNPSQDFIKYLTSRIYSGRLTAKTVEQFSGVVQRSTKNFISDMINTRLQTALNSESTSTKIEVAEEKPIVAAAEPEVAEETEVADETPRKEGVETTEEELQGYRIVQAILAEHIELDRIAHRDTKSYFGILLDNNNRKPLCRLWFNQIQKRIEVFGADRKSEKIAIDEVNDIYKHKEKIVASISCYEEA